MSRAEVFASLDIPASGFVVNAGGGFAFSFPATPPRSASMRSWPGSTRCCWRGRPLSTRWPWAEHMLALGPRPRGGKRGVLVTSRGGSSPKRMIAMPPGPAALALALAALGAKRVRKVGGPRTLAPSHAAWLLDRLELHVMPVPLGAGIPLGFAPASLTLDEATTVPLGVVRPRWRVLRP